MNIKNRKLNSLLVEAIMNNNPNEVKDFLNKGADPNGFIDHDQLTPLFFAVQNNALSSAFILLAAGADPNRENVNIRLTPLKLAELNNFHDVINLLKNYKELQNMDLN